MTPSERERRIAVVAREVAAVWPSHVLNDDSLIVLLAERFLDAADEVVPVVGQQVKDEQQEILDRQFWDMREAWRLAVERAERVEAATREVVQAQAVLCAGVDGEQPHITAELHLGLAIQRLRAVLEQAPSFSGEEGTEE